jgi:uncharacterized protein (TIGR02996 family)
MARPCFCDPACRLPDEYGVLAAVLDAPAADLPKRVYADFLEDHADPRGAFLREWVAGASSGPPPADHLPASWLSLVGFTLDHEIRRYDRPAWEAAVRQAAMPGLYVRTEPRGNEPFAPGASRVGGRPELPPDAVLTPECGSMAFLAQFSLSELAASPVCRVLPRAGLLSLFAELDPPGLFADGRALVTPSLAGLAERKHTGLELVACRVEFVEWMTLPPPYSAALDRHRLTPAHHAEYEDLYASFPRPNGVVHQLLGHPSSAQTLPKPGCEAAYTLLAELGADERAGLTAGRWRYVIPERALREGRFDVAHLEHQPD